MRHLQDGVADVQGVIVLDAAAYLSDLIQTAVPVRPVRSSDASLLTVPRTRTDIAWRAFLVATATTRSSLPSNIRACPHSNDTSKLTYSDNPNMRPPAPL